jgi:transposase
MVMIGIDPHKGTHTAVAIDDREQVLTERLVRATHRQVPELVAWADELGNGERIWAVESAGGVGYLLAQQLLAAGETVVDVPPLRCLQRHGPIEWSSGNPKRPTHRLSRRGNRAMNHALHIAAVTQLPSAQADFPRKATSSIACSRSWPAAEHSPPAGGPVRGLPGVAGSARP